jgi:hypothetical protein
LKGRWEQQGLIEDRRNYPPKRDPEKDGERSIAPFGKFEAFHHPL